jgi:hypothetical protein
MKGYKFHRILADPPSIDVVLDVKPDPVPDASDFSVVAPYDSRAGAKRLRGWRIELIDDGSREFILHLTPRAPAAWTPVAGAHVYLVLPSGDKLATTVAPGDRRAAEHAQITSRLDDMGTGIGSLIGAARGVRRDLNELTAFNIGVDTDGGPAAPGAGSRAAEDVVAAQLRRIFGRTPDADDPAGTLAALDRNLTFEETDGVGRWVLKPYSVSVNASNGAGLTGYQRSLNAFARQVGDEVLPLLDGLTPLRPERHNPSELSAARSGFRRSLEAFIGETASDTGIVQDLADILLGQAKRELARVGAELGMLQHGAKPVEDRVPSRDNVITVADEESFTDYIVIRDRFNALALGYHAFTQGKDTFTLPVSDERTDLGMQLTLLEQDVDLLQEAADELDAAFISVGVGPDERAAVLLDPCAPTGPSIQGFLDRVRAFPSQEARPLIAEGGVRGVALLLERLTLLDGWAKTLQNRAEHEHTAGLGHGRVRVALDKVQRVIAEAIKDVDAFPDVTQYDPGPVSPSNGGDATKLKATP